VGTGAVTASASAALAMGNFSPYRIKPSFWLNFAKISAMHYANRQLKSVPAFDMGNFESGKTRLSVAGW
jgi:chloramphenicol O-acetyltransferase